MLVTVISKTLELNQRFTISRGTKTAADSVFISLDHEGVVGWGEASPNSRYGENVGSCMRALAIMVDGLGNGPGPFVHTMERLFAMVEGEYAAKAALDMALMDYMGKRYELPNYELWGLDPTKVVPTSFTIPMDEPEKMAQRALTAQGFQFLKIKLGGGQDRAMVEAIRKVTDKTIRVDANEAWQDRTEALAEIQWLSERNVDLVEQPMPAAQLEDAAWLKERSPLPLIADEAFTTVASLHGLAAGYHGVNIKLQKCGGTNAARAAIAVARSLDMKVMIGCMVESSLAVAAGVHLSPLADYLDLDGHLFIKNDPFDGLQLIKGCVHPGLGPGFGQLPNSAIMMPDDEYDSFTDTSFEGTES